MTIQLEILQYSYLEHFKAAKDLAFILPIGHEKRISLQKEIDKILAEIKNVKPRDKVQCGVEKNNI